MRIKKAVPFEFALDALDGIPFETRPMFGCTAVYVGEKIVLVLRSKTEHPRDNGVWIGTTHVHHESLRKEFPMMRSIELLGAAPTAWQTIPVDEPHFESAVLRLCALIVEGDERIGKIPSRRGGKKTKAAKKAVSGRRKL